MDLFSFKKPDLEILRAEISRLKKDCDIINPVIRDDIYRILEEKSTVLFYPVEDGPDGYRTKKYVNGEYRDFVFINSALAEENQIFTAAHELGHILEIDKKLSVVCGESFSLADVESIMNRFAAEILMDEQAFLQIADKTLKTLETLEDASETVQIFATIVSLMDYFLCPYKAVLYRLYEIEKISKESCLLFEKLWDKNKIKEAIKSYPSKRLLRPTNIKSFSNINKLLIDAAKQEAMGATRLNGIAELFEINLEDIQKEQNNIPSELKEGFLKDV